jgi:hypothetical protein
MSSSEYSRYQSPESSYYHHVHHGHLDHKVGYFGAGAALGTAAALGGVMWFNKFNKPAAMAANVTSPSPSPTPIHIIRSKIDKSPPKSR